MKFLLSTFCFLLCLMAHGQTFSKGTAFIAEAVPATVASSGITFDTVATNLDTSAESPETFTHTIGNLANGYIMLHLASYGAGPSAVTFDGSSMTKLISYTNASDANLKGALWGLAVGSKGAGTYTVSMTMAAAQGAYCFTTAWNGVHQTTSTGTVATAEGFTTTPSVVVTSAAGEVVVDILARIQGGAATVGSDQTDRGNAISEGNIGGACSSEPGAASVTMSWSYASDSHTVRIGIPLKPAS